jgi:hypothetical protein
VDFRENPGEFGAAILPEEKSVQLPGALHIQAGDVSTPATTSPVTLHLLPRSFAGDGTFSVPNSFARIV